MPHTPERIAIVGSPGSGKSRLARELGEVLGLDVYHLDDLHWRPGGVRMSDAEWSKTHADLIARDEWIIDGTFSGTMRERFGRADTIVFLDVSPLVCVLRVLRRRAGHALRRRGERPNYPVYVDAELIGWVFRFRRDKGREIRRLMDTLSGETRTVTIRTDADVRDLLGQLAHARAIE